MDPKAKDTFQELLITLNCMFTGKTTDGKSIPPEYSIVERFHKISDNGAIAALKAINENRNNDSLPQNDLSDIAAIFMVVNYMFLGLTSHLKSQEDIAGYPELTADDIDHHLINFEDAPVEIKRAVMAAVLIGGMGAWLETSSRQLFSAQPFLPSEFLHNSAGGMFHVIRKSRLAGFKVDDTEIVNAIFPPNTTKH